MIGLLIANTVALCVCIALIVGQAVLLYKAEKKLAKHNESWMFKKK